MFAHNFFNLSAMNKLNANHDILLADDDIDDVEILVWSLSEAGIQHELRHADNGDRLFVLLKEKIPYILFLDIQMPCKDGISCIMEIRKNREYDKLPVIMYTSFTHAEYIETTYRNSANFYLTKSGDSQAVVRHLKQIFAIDWHNYQHYPVIDDFVLR